MGDIVNTVTIETTGKLFTDPEGVINRNGELMQVEIARYSAEMVRDRLRDVLVNPTGNYVAAVTSELRGDHAVVTDSGVIYGPWLEGVASRNEQSRFKGYAAFRRTAAEAEAQADMRTELLQRKMVAELEAP